MNDSAHPGTGPAQRTDRGKAAASDVTSTFRDEARTVTDTVAGAAREQLSGLGTQTRDRLTQEVESQTHHTADTVRRWADDLSQMVEAAPSGPARALVAQVADRGHQVADTLDQRGFGGLVEDVQRFARRQPAAFLGGAALAGVVAGRLAKAGKAASHHDDGHHGDGFAAQQATARPSHGRSPAPGPVPADAADMPGAPHAVGGPGGEGVS